MSDAARRFMELVSQVWSGDEYAATADAGYLSETDEAALVSICLETGGEVAEVADEIVEICRDRCNRRKELAAE